MESSFFLIVVAGNSIQVYFAFFTCILDDVKFLRKVILYLTYNENDLFVKPCRNQNFVQNPLIMLARIWNHLQDTIKSVEDTKLFVKN